MGAGAAEVWNVTKFSDGPVGGWNVTLITNDGTWYIGPVGEDLAKAIAKMGEITSKIIKFPVPEGGMNCGFLGMSQKDWQPLVQGSKEALALLMPETRGKL